VNHAPRLSLVDKQPAPVSPVTHAGAAPQTPLTGAQPRSH